jgi:hypothetical protein
MQTTDTQKIIDLMLSKKIVMFCDIEGILNLSRMTIIRRLRKLSYLSSYSHKGKYYTLASIPKFSEEGIWNYNEVYFSKYDSLINTCYYFVNKSQAGYSVKELQAKLGVNVARIGLANHS